ncbi:hypothetical protein BSL78_25167 [Apostichopus japonicus]|uniref:Uncharacterized protein n=1 Tax=Stichopus japonicus TaxID=307972 RepID=A0A2G8JQL4_STIJA|nr:hypothetical protein BSL78_25167 [Apostichopus japonicus]
MTIKDTDERNLDKTDHDAREQTKDDRGKDEKKQISSDPVSSAKDKSTTNIESQKEQEEEATAKMDVDERNDSAKGDLSKADSSDSKPINHIAEASTEHPADKVIPTDKDKRSTDTGIVEEKTDDGSNVNKKVRQPRDDLLPAAFRDAVEPSAVDQDLRDLDAYTRGPNDVSPRARNWGDVPRNFFDAEGKRGADVTEVREDIDLRGPRKENEGAEKQPAIPSLMSLSGIAEAHPRFIRSPPDVERRRLRRVSLRSPRNTIGSWKKRNNSAGQGCSRTGRGKCYRRMKNGH